MLEIVESDDEDEDLPVHENLDQSEEQAEDEGLAVSDALGVRE